MIPSSIKTSTWNWSGRSWIEIEAAFDVDDKSTNTKQDAKNSCRRRFECKRNARDNILCLKYFFIQSKWNVGEKNVNHFTVVKNVLHALSLLFVCCVWVDKFLRKRARREKNGREPKKWQNKSWNSFIVLKISSLVHPRSIGESFYRAVKVKGNQYQFICFVVERHQITTSFSFSIFSEWILLSSRFFSCSALLCYYNRLENGIV